MAKIYADLVVKGLKTIDQVPAKLRQQVANIVEKTIQYYVNEIQIGAKTIDDVPAGIKQEVIERIVNN